MYIQQRRQKSPSKQSSVWESLSGGPTRN